MTTPLGTKIRDLRKQKGYTLDKLAELTDSSKSYIWELENKSPPRPSADKVARIAAALGVTSDYLVDVNASVTVEDAADQAFYRKYREMDPATKNKIRRMADLLKEQMFERRVRAIVREEIEAAKSYKPQPGDAIAISDVSTRGAKLSAWTSDPNLAALICEHIDQFNALTPEQQEEHLRKQRESWVRGEMGLGLDNKRATEEGGDPHSGSGQASTREDKSPPAVEAPAAGDSQEMADRLRSIARDPNNFITRAGSLIEAASMLADTTALARRLAEELSKIVRHVVVPETAIEALTEARKAGLIE